MKPHLFRTALTAAAILLPLQAEAESAASGSEPRPTPVSFTPARGGWAFSHPQDLRILSGKTLKLEVPAGEYEKLRVGMFDAGRREMLSFRIPTEQFVAMAAEPELELKAGSARMHLRKRAMGMLRDVARRLAPAATGAR